MAMHIMALTYAPKISAVKSGECCQTVRRYNPKRPKREGDVLTIHTWAGRPYRSQWDWRLTVPISHIIRLRYYSETCQMLSFDGGDIWVHTDELGLKNIAINDGIENASAASLKATLKALNHLDSLSGTEWEIIQWNAKEVSA